MTSYNIAKKIVQRFVDAGYTAYFAGGWVRDYLMDHPSDDIDIVTSASVEVTQSLFEKTIPVGINFGIVIVVEDEHQFEVASFRKESGYDDGRRPGFVESANPQEDALRRDFTINGLFFDPLSETIYDYVDGRADLDRGIVRAIGDPNERFLEDRLRMIRAVRYSARFHFPIEKETEKAIIHHAKDLFPSVAIERVWSEFEKLGKFPGFERGLLSLHKLGLLGVIFPALVSLSVEEIDRRIDRIPDLPDNTPTIAKLLELFPEAGLDEKLSLCDYFKLSNRERDFVIYYDHALKSLELPLESLDKYTWAKLYAHPHFGLCLANVATRCLEDHREKFVQTHENHYLSLEPYILRIKQKSPLVRATHLTERGVKPGPKMGELLREAEKLSINEGILDIDNVLDRLELPDGK
ncbi:MAG: CCA tRNA nucleotidyltransferase [Simkaniaceae bacterium]|nr:CCA tRNA nucleotidyltransferase [Simkaniaceae bacterium]